MVFPSWELWGTHSNYSSEHMATEPSPPVQESAGGLPGSSGTEEMEFKQSSVFWFGRGTNVCSILDYAKNTFVPVLLTAIWAQSSHAIREGAREGGYDLK